MRNVLIVFAGLMVILVVIATTLWRLDRADSPLGQYMEATLSGGREEARPRPG